MPCNARGGCPVVSLQEERSVTQAGTQGEAYRHGREDLADENRCVVVSHVESESEELMRESEQQ